MAVEYAASPPSAAADEEEEDSVSLLLLLLLSFVFASATGGVDAAERAGGEVVAEPGVDTRSSAWGEEVGVGANGVFVCMSNGKDLEKKSHDDLHLPTPPPPFPHLLLLRTPPLSPSSSPHRPDRYHPNPCMRDKVSGAFSQDGIGNLNHIHCKERFPFCMKRRLLFLLGWWWCIANKHCPCIDQQQKEVEHCRHRPRDY